MYLQSFLEAGIPINLLIEKYPSLVLVVAPDLAELDNPHLTSQIHPDQLYRLIRCGSSMGIIHVLKHLRSSLVILSSDAPSKVPIEIAPFVGEVVTLHREKESDEFIQSLLS